MCSVIRLALFGMLLFLTTRADGQPRFGRPARGAVDKPAARA